MYARCPYIILVMHVYTHKMHAWSTIIIIIINIINLVYFGVNHMEEIIFKSYRLRFVEYVILYYFTGALTVAYAKTIKTHYTKS